MKVARRQTLSSQGNLTPHRYRFIAFKISELDWLRWPGQHPQEPAYRLHRQPLAREALAPVASTENLSGHIRAAEKREDAITPKESWQPRQDLYAVVFSVGGPRRRHTTGYYPGRAQEPTTHKACRGHPTLSRRPHESQKEKRLPQFKIESTRLTGINQPRFRLNSASPFCWIALFTESLNDPGPIRAAQRSLFQ